MSLQLDEAQALAADPEINAFVTANAGSGKTKTLIDRVARLLLAGAPPSAILCVTYTKAAAAEMQGRLFGLLGDWAVTPDEALSRALDQLLGPGHGRDLADARKLFARALETPGGLKIQTIHAFCEQLLRRFPMEAGISPRFTVMDDAAAALAARDARERLAGVAGAGPSRVSEAYARLAIALDYLSFEGLFRTFQERRGAIGDYLAGLGGYEGAVADVWRRCGFEAPSDVETVEREAVAATDTGLWRAAAAVLGQGGKTDVKCAEQLLAAVEASDFPGMLAALFTQGGAGTPAAWVAKTSGLKGREDLREALLAEQDRLAAARERRRGAVIAEDTLAVLCLAEQYADAYEQAKQDRGVLDFADLVAKARDLVSASEGAAWVLYKLDGGLEHILIDEAQDTAPEQWAIAQALTDEFFAGAGRARPAASPHRTLFIVGDEKQSIYSFQGADPDRLVAETDRYLALINAADHKAVRAPLNTSYRSVATVLAFVDSLFSDPRTQIGVKPPVGAESLTHVAFRVGHPGCVDLWPLETEEPAQERGAWDAPLDVEAEESANRRLARRIAREIKALVARGDTVYDKAGHPRAATFGDVIVLVRRRRALFEDIIRELRRAQVPVAGADRLTLSEHIAFDDLMALARFVQFPNDDLNLAALLKSPLCGLDDEDIYSLARRRLGSLWDQLRTADAAAVAAARTYLEAGLSLAPGRPPFEFYSRMLGLRDAGGRSARARMLERLGSEAGDVMDEFLSRTLEAEQRGVLDLERLAAAFEGLEISVKREMEAGAGEVRVMTAHGAKGLEAPIVFLPETTVKTGARGSALLETEDGGFLWAARQGDDCAASAAARQRRKDRDEGESWRLLYVGLTRARDRLVLCGRAPARLKEGTQPEGWYGAMASAFDRLEAGGQVEQMADGEFLFRRFGTTPAPFVGDAPDAEAVAPPPPAWIVIPAPVEPPATAWSSPSQAASRSRLAAPSPLAREGGLDRFRRGDLIHRLLQLLPDVEPEARRETARRMLAHEPDLSETQRDEMAAAALGVLEHPDFAEVFGPGSRAEVALAGSAKALPTGLAISGRVDRLVVTSDRVLVVDYKTNRPAPASAERADPAYIAQLAIYAAVLGEVFPDRRVEAALVWTDGPKLMPIPEKMMAEALAALPGAR